MNNILAFISLPLLLLHQGEPEPFRQSQFLFQPISKPLSEQKTELATRQLAAPFEPTSYQLTTGGKTPASLTTVSPHNQVSQNQDDLITGTITSIQGSAERMISYRHQKHMWLTPDGAMHVFVNLGNNAQGASLTLYSSFDRGITWNPMLELPNTNDQSTSDGFLINKTLRIVYSSSTGGIFFSELNYDVVQKTWSYTPPTTVYQGIYYTASSPTITIDANKNLWVGFVAQQISTRGSFIRLSNSLDRGVSWTDTQINLGVTSTSTRKNARLIALGDRVGAIYTNDTTINWAYRMNDWSTTTPWQTQQIFQHQSIADVDPFASHFSVVVDRLKNIHFVTKNEGRLLYLRFNSQNQNWDNPRILSGETSVRYVQISISLDQKLLILANRYNKIALYESSDHGDNFYLTKLLKSPLASSPPSGGLDVDSSQPRMESPTVVNNTLPVLQQFQQEGSQGLIYFNIDLDNQSSQLTTSGQRILPSLPAGFINNPPVVPNSDTDVPSCYMESNGRTLDLSLLCR